MNILKRNSTTINIATFWENHQLSKYNFDPDYQRPSDVWSESQKSFLIDTILKNFPMPPIFLHQHIDQATGKTKYDVIDGKQRLMCILSFINNEISTPDDFDSDGFGEASLSRKFFRDLDKEQLNDWKKIFWRYELTIEYIDTDQDNVVENIFDRLNRNGMPLTPQELRNAKYHATNLYKLVKELETLTFFEPIFAKIQKNRLEHEDFISELLFSLIDKNLINGDKAKILDDFYDKYASTFTEEDFIRLNEQFTSITNSLKDSKIEYKAYYIEGLSHIYVLWILSMHCYLNSVKIVEFSDKINLFYKNLREEPLDLLAKEVEHLSNYRKSMSAGTKSRSRRVLRVNSLIQYCDIKVPLF